MADADSPVNPIDPNKTRVDPDFGKPRVPPKLPQRIPQGASHDFARTQRNVPTEAIPQKDIPTQQISSRGKPMPGAKTEILSPQKSASPPRPVAPSRTIDPRSAEGLERVAQEIPKEVAREAQTAARQAGRSGLWSKLKPRLRAVLGPVALVGMAVGIIGFAIFNYATDEVLKKMGPDADLSTLLPTANKVLWMDAPFERMSRDESDPYYEPNVVNEDVTITPPQSGILALGISLAGLPNDFINDTNINDAGGGKSDWLCEPFGGYLICRSISGADPLIKDAKSIISMQFHLPGSEMKKMLTQKSGTRSVYLFVSR
ncbi:MAG: hypothetical protein A3G60_01545 [Candidatus Ryanbacteria bacterium RIFCSPLOWO2_12_FULL_47_9c]|uniref:Uncharacterized protein n=1 Tax=Candidatus Ryanbacteria bacterium RIFCSPLOWO2_12_FULL_47_9c TaxID=1802131 RepID=A0A1G2H5U2_9BACT|nr:MAG: hypothetical protein A3G60_01545 [Candidatus Ryanbacteria bacterium RIFCSPLOWO2_12_FULL_47_9c]